MDNHFETVVNRRTGKPIEGATITVQTEAGAIATIYSDNGVTELANPFTSDADGFYNFYAADGRYTVTISGPGIDTRSYSVLLEDPSTGSVTPDDGSVTDAKVAAGSKLKNRVDDVVSVKDVGAKGDGVTDDTAAIVAAFSEGRAVLIPTGTYALSAGVKITSQVNSDAATFKYTANVTTAIELGANAAVEGVLNLDLSGVTCTNGILLSGAEQFDHKTAPRCDTINVKGKNHTDSVNGVMLDATVAGPGNRSWIHYAKLGRISVENFQIGVHAKTSEATIVDSWVNANVIDEPVLVGCKRPILCDATAGGEVSANFVNRYVIQCGFVEGSGYISGIEVYGNSLYNEFDGFVFDWDDTVAPYPQVRLGLGTYDNRITCSAPHWAVEDKGARNRYVSSAYPSMSNIWMQPHGRNFLGNQDNCLAHFSPVAGTLTGAASSTGTASVSLTGSTSLDNAQKENGQYAEFTFVAGTGIASHTLEFVSTTSVIDKINMAGVYFEPGYTPAGLRVDLKIDSSWVTKAEFENIAANEVFARFDPSAGSDIYDTVLGVRFVISASDNRVVRVRQVFANGIMPKTFVSRGGDRMGGDLLFDNGGGPMLIDTATGDHYRVKVTNGVLGLSPSWPTKKMTYF